MVVLGAGFCGCMKHWLEFHGGNLEFTGIEVANRPCLLKRLVAFPAPTAGLNRISLPAAQKHHIV